MSRAKEGEVLIVGAGPAGLATALYLRERGVDVHVVDPRELIDADARAIVLERETLGRLAAAGVTFELAREARRIETISTYDGPRRGGASAARPRPRGGLVVPLWVLAHGLETALRARGVHVAWSHRLLRLDPDPTHIRAEIAQLDLDSAGYAIEVHERVVIRTRMHEPSYVIGADGCDSVVRIQLGMGWREAGAPARVIAFEVDTGVDLGDTARVVIGDAIAEIWPLSGDRAYVMFTLPERDGEPAPSAAALDGAMLRALLDEHAPGHVVPVRGIRRTSIERVAPGAATRPILGRAALVGGAARVLPPSLYAVDATLRDAHALALAIAGALRDGVPPAAAGLTS